MNDYQVKKMFVVAGVSEDTQFQAQTRNEIGGIEYVVLISR
jgi:hypothetical protein